MTGHDQLVGYRDNAAATAAVHMVQAERDRQTPYRVWQCVTCHKWHAGAWIEHAHEPELEPERADQVSGVSG